MRPMRLFWLTFNTRDGTEVFIEAGYLLMARMKAGLAGQAGAFHEGHQLDDVTAKKIPAAMIGKTLSREQAARLLDRL